MLASVLCLARGFARFRSVFPPQNARGDAPRRRRAPHSYGAARSGRVRSAGPDAPLLGERQRQPARHAASHLSASRRSDLAGVVVPREATREPPEVVACVTTTLAGAASRPASRRLATTPSRRTERCEGRTCPTVDQG